MNKVSVCITVFNEQKSIEGLIRSLLNQSKKPNEIVVVDGGSTDRTVSIIRHLQKKYGGIKLLVENCTRAKGRNLAVELAKNEIIAITDADCTADKNWLKNITEPFEHKEIDIVAGFYNMCVDNSFQKAESVFLGVLPNKFGNDFLPSTRSIAFRKRIWEEIGGFPEGNNNSAEDTDFNYKAAKLGAKYARIKNALVEWRIPDNIQDFKEKIYNYASWDANYGIWWHPVKKFSSHNIKVLTVFARYLVGLTLIALSFKTPSLLWLAFVLLILYILWAFRKVYMEYRDWRAGLWGIVLQFASDFVVMSGFISGMITK